MYFVGVGRLYGGRPEIFFEFFGGPWEPRGGKLLKLPPPGVPPVDARILRMWDALRFLCFVLGHDTIRRI